MDDEVVEFSVAHNRKYSRDHLWYQEKDERLMIGVSEFLAVEIGEVLRVILPQAEYEIDEGRDMFSIWTAEEKVAFPSQYSGIIAEVNGEVEINPTLSTIPHTTMDGLSSSNLTKWTSRISSTLMSTSSTLLNFE